ncbi:hypothetical protein Tco_0311426 [Tanacetum coccineum]
MANNETECSPSEVCLSDSDNELLIPTPGLMSPRMKKGKKDEEKNLNGKDPWKQNGNLVEMPSEVVEQGMDDHVPNEIDGAKGEQVPNHAVKKCNLEFLVCKQVANHGGDELVEKGRPLKRKRMYAEYMDDIFTKDERQC